MNYNTTKKIIVLNDIPSNLIEEAILILKTDKDFTNSPKIKNLSTSKDILLSEANFILNNYINEISTQSSQIKTKKIKKKHTNLIINISLGFSFLLLFFLIVQLILA